MKEETKKWWQSAVVYQIYCKSFCDSNGDGIGDLQGVISKLPMLQELGVDCIWLNPIFPSPQCDNGYDIADYDSIDPCFGTMDDFRQLLDEAHKRGIRVLLDMVMNHSSDKHPWFVRSRQSKDDPYRNYYIWRPAKPDGSAPNNWGNYCHEGDGSAWTYDEKTGEYYLHEYLQSMPDLNWEYEPLRSEMYAMMRRWLDMGVDGFRLDVLNRIQKPAGLPDSKKAPAHPGDKFVLDRVICANVEGIHEKIHDMYENVWQHYDMMTVGEMPSATPENSLPYIQRQRCELNMLFHFLLQRKPGAPKITPQEYKNTQQSWIDLLPKGGWLAQWLSNHDHPRHVSCMGNDREYRVESAKLLALLNHTMPGTPYVYQGEEIGMTNVAFDDISAYRDCNTIGLYQVKKADGFSDEQALRFVRPTSRDNARTPYQWNDEKHAGFTTGTPWLGVNPNYKHINLRADRDAPDSIFRFYQKLIALRKTEPAIVDGDFTFWLKEHPQMVVYTRRSQTQTLLVVCNFSDERALFSLPQELLEKKWKRLLTNRENAEASLTRRDFWSAWEAELYTL